jgi:hypothetical protein
MISRGWLARLKEFYFSFGRSRFRRKLSVMGALWGLGIGSWLQIGFDAEWGERLAFGVLGFYFLSIRD